MMANAVHHFRIIYFETCFHPMWKAGYTMQLFLHIFIRDRRTSDSVPLLTAKQSTDLVHRARCFAARHVFVASVPLVMWNFTKGCRVRSTKTRSTEARKHLTSGAKKTMLNLARIVTRIWRKTAAATTLPAFDAGHISAGCA